MRAKVHGDEWVMRAIVACVFAALVVTFTARAGTSKVKLTTDSSLSLKNGVLRDHGRAYTGHLVERYPNGNTKRDATYENGRLSGLTVGLFESGRHEYERTYVHGRENGEHRGWYENGARRFVFHYRDGQSEGEQEEWFVSGAKYTLFHYSAGHELGAQQLWNEDGTLRANYVIRDGRRYGLPGATGCLGKRDSAMTVTP